MYVMLDLAVRISTSGGVEPCGTVYDVVILNVPPLIVERFSFLLTAKGSIKSSLSLSRNGAVERGKHVPTVTHAQ